MSCMGRSFRIETHNRPKKSPNSFHTLSGLNYTVPNRLSQDDEAWFYRLASSDLLHPPEQIKV